MGYISMILGCMFAQKTTELLRRVRRYKSIGYKVLIVNYIGDTRYGKECIASHDKEVEQAMCVGKLEDIETIDAGLSEKEIRINLPYNFLKGV